MSFRVITWLPSNILEHQDQQRNLRMCACGDSCYPKDL